MSGAPQPHCRENCLNIPFVDGKMHETCDQCYCFVCDAPTSECEQWDAHCMAVHSSPMWQKARADHKAKQAAATAIQPAAANASGPGTSTLPLSVAAPRGAVQATKAWSCDAMLKALQQVYPTEAREPDGLLSSITLRPYQRQSLAFMLAIEHGENKDGAGEVWVESYGQAQLRYWATKRLERDGPYLRAIYGPNSRRLKQLEDKVPPDADERRQVRSGWLCDESACRSMPLPSQNLAAEQLRWMCSFSQWAWARPPS